MSNIHVERGCGRRKKGGFYLEAKTSSGGQLNLLTYCFGTHLDTQSTIPASNLIADIPPRGVWFGHLPAAFLTGEWLPIGNPFSLQNEHSVIYEELKRCFLSPYCLGDKVSKKYYSCASFIQEALEYGPSRKIPPTMAKQITAYLPIPILFFFDLPIFHSEAQRDSLLIQCGLSPEAFEMNALWHDPNYGISVDYPNAGDFHFMTKLIDYLGSEEGKAFIRAEGIQTAVMPGCICWLNQVRYMLTDEDDQEDKAQEMMQYGIEVVDLASHVDEETI